MSTAVLELDLEKLPSEIALPKHYRWALIVIYLRKNPIRQALVPVMDGHIREMDLRDKLLRDIDWPLGERWLCDYLEWDETPVEGPLPSATVAVCTRDRPEDLQRCLEALLRLPDDGQEMLVIDNCPSTDATWQVVREHSNGDGRRVRYIREDRAGLDRARNRALREATHEIVAFIDDDAVADPGWLRALLSNFRDPQVLCVTGLTLPLELETASQEWFERYSPFGRGFARAVFDMHNLNPLIAGRVGAGANMAFRRAVIDLLGPFEEALDAGTPTRTGGDTEMFYRVLKNGYHIVYTPTAINRHRHRRTWQALQQALYGHGVGVYAFWTHCLLAEREFGVFKIAWDWFWRTQLPALARSYRRRRQDEHQSRAWEATETPFDLLLAELRGCLAGPKAYLSARRETKTI